MVYLSAEPPSTVRTVPQLMELARGVSRQALLLYEDLARRMAELDNTAARDAFERIGVMLGEGEIPEPAEKTADLPIVFQEEDLAASRLVTPYAAYSLAVRNQERAFAVWTYISANSSDPGVGSEAERLARDELARVKSLRTARRRAFHASRPPAVSLDALRAASTEQLKRQAGEIEGALAQLHDRIAASLAEVGDARAPLMRACAAEERDNASHLDTSPTPDQPPEPLPENAESLVALATERLEAAVELYLTASEVLQREEMVSVAQDLANRGIRRLSLLR